MKKYFTILLLAIIPILTICKKTVDTPKIIFKQKKNISKDQKIDFESYQLGTIPASWSNYFTGKGQPGKWEIRLDKKNKVLAQVSQKNSGYHFDVIIINKIVYHNLLINIRFKGIKGKEDQGGGPVWRYQNENNYYIARANPLENNFRLYKVVNAKRIQLASANINIPAKKWHSIKIKMFGNKIEAYFNDKKYFNIIDTTFQNYGQVGLWTKADSFTYFDDIEVKKIFVGK